jgi:NAD(P)-dependent dehydrogenase (short-subunit alcohol dehydrogenase family)
MPWSPDRHALRGRVAVVTGATRGAGRGIAAALGEAGATVVCTGRSSGSARSDYNRPETIEETAELVMRLGGTGIPIAVDHLDPAQVSTLAERLRKDHGHIDVLVNDIWGGELLLKGGPAQWNRSAPLSSRTPTGSRTSMALSPTSGAISRRLARPAVAPTSATLGETPPRRRRTGSICRI